MEAILFFLPLLAGGVGLSILLSALWRKRPSALPWPLLFFLAVLGTAANNTAAVCLAGADAFLPSGGGFLGGDDFTAFFTGIALALFALPGIIGCALHRPKVETRPAPLVGTWIWGWVLTQGALAVVIIALAMTIGFLPFSDREGYGGLPLWAYLALMAALHLLAGFLVGRKLPGTRKKQLLMALAGCVPLCLGTAALLGGMLAQANDVTWGLSLMQTPCGTWYGRLALPAAVLLGDYQYAWDITPAGLWCSALLPHLLFAAGSVAAILCKRGNEYD